MDIILHLIPPSSPPPSTSPPSKVSSEVSDWDLDLVDLVLENLENLPLPRVEPQSDGRLILTQHELRATDIPFYRYSERQSLASFWYSHSHSLLTLEARKYRHLTSPVRLHSHPKPKRNIFLKDLVQHFLNILNFGFQSLRSLPKFVCQSRFFMRRWGMNFPCV